MAYDLAQLARAQGVRRTKVLRDIKPPAMFATNLYHAVYAPIVQEWSMAVPAIMAEYSRALGDITTDSPADVQAAIDGADNAASVLFFSLTPRLKDWALRVEKWQRSKWRGAVLSASNVDIGQLIGPFDVRATLDTTIARNVGLIKDVSAQARQRISSAVFDGLRNRTPARDVAKLVRAAVGMSRRRSVNIASDQLNKLTSALADERRREAGIHDWLWLHSGKLHPREEHKARDGKEYSDANAPNDRPGMLPYCGCRQRGVLKLDDDE
jgi:uncharacterized protein with gpF-like domain